jgi:hypothetical protein
METVQKLHSQEQMRAKRLLFRKPMKTADLLKRRLELIYGWYQGMVNPDTGILEYLYVPQTNTFVREKCPIRDIGSVWDVETLGRFLNKQELFPIVEKSLSQFDDYLLEREGYLILDPAHLEEPSSIAHSAFMILALLNSPPHRRIQQIVALADGILQQQRPNGSYRVYFEDLPDQGEELYAGEAMLALLEIYRQYEDIRYLPSVERGLSYYDEQHFRRDLVAEDALVFFANWQSQACRLVFEYTRNNALKQNVADYVYRMHDQIIARGFYEDVKSHPTRQVPVEVACALEGLNDAYALARASKDERSVRYHQCICVGLDYLLKLQCTENGAEKERGGFGLSLDDRSQRIDITGHAASALMKTVENGTEC